MFQEIFNQFKLYLLIYIQIFRLASAKCKCSIILQMFNLFANQYSIRHQDFRGETPFLAPTPLRYVRDIKWTTYTASQGEMKIEHFSIQIFEFKKFSMNSMHVIRFSRIFIQIVQKT